MTRVLNVYMNPISNMSSSINCSNSNRWSDDSTSSVSSRGLWGDRRRWQNEATNDSEVANLAIAQAEMISVYSEPPENALTRLSAVADADTDTDPYNYNNRYKSTATTESGTRLEQYRAMREELNKKLDDVLGRRSIVVDALAMFFGIGTWIGINGIFIQLPLLVEEAPEGWSLPSYLSVMVQMGNLGAIAYTLIQKFAKNKKSDANMIYGMLALGTVSSLLTAFLYNKTAQVFGSERSLAMFILTFCTAINACTSSVLFMPYMGRFKEIYLVTYFIGEGLSGLLPSVVALIQGIGGTAECVLKNVTETGTEIYEKYTPPPRFGSMSFFLFIFLMMLCSCVGFTLLDRLKIVRQQYAAVQVKNGNSYKYEANEDVSDSTANLSKAKAQAVKVSPTQYACLLSLIGVVSFFSNGMFNSILSYSCLPYGGQAYHLSATLSVIANPVACFLAIFLPHRSLRSIVALFGFAIVLTAYVFVTAAMSPLPPLHGTTAGAAIVITSWTLLIGLVSYIKLGITTVMRAQGGKSLVWTGGLTQVGSLIGSILIFVLINFTNSFQASYADDC